MADNTIIQSDFPKGLPLDSNKDGLGFTCRLYVSIRTFNGGLSIYDVLKQFDNP